MDKMKKFLLTLFVTGFLFCPYAQAQETALFTTLAPDALIVLDLSGSMNWTPVGKWMYTLDGGSCDSTTDPFYGESALGRTKICEIPSSGDIPKYSNNSCTGPFYRTSDSGHTRNCTRLAIAKKALFDVLDDNQSNTITSADENSLGIRIGYMRFWNCLSDETDGSYTSGCNQLVWGLGSKYSRIYCNNPTSCASTANVSGSISGESASGGTPLAAALHEAKLYLDYHKSTDAAASCRQKFAILITDGADTFACGGNGNEDQTDMYKRRRETVAKAKALADAGYKTFVVGFGTSMPHFARNTLNWAAYYGGADNPLVENSGDPGAYVPSGISCEDSANELHNIEGDGEHYYAIANDPGELPLSGYAFLAGNADDLTTALKAAINILRESTFSFSLTSVASSRTQDENNIYEASFQPITGDPFWHGHLKKYDIASDGNVGAVVWDAGTVLQSRSAADRNIKTYLSGGIVSFTTDNISRTMLGVSTDALRNSVVGFFRGDFTYNKENWKMGDIFRSNPITIGTPSIFFQDTRDGSKAFESFRANHERTSLNTKRVILVGANDGQIHAFQTSDAREIWSFIPPNLLPKLKNVAHSTHPTGLSHQYFVDGPVSIADAWLGSGTGTSKSPGDWKTLMVFGEGRGGSPNLWSSSSSCDSGFNPVYTSAYPYYCGYYAFDYTDTTIDPVYKWRLNPTSAQAPYLGEPWSKVAIGRVVVDGNEKWVGFFGAGYNGSDCALGGECDTRGKGFYVVELSSGNILWSYTRADSSTMNYSLPAQPVIVDTDNDGFIDTVYVGDLGGNMWRFKFCTADQSNCGTANWAGGLLYDSSSGTIRPIYTAATVARDRFNHLWLYWGTGDKTDPTAANAQEKFFAMKDDSRSGTYNINNLENITTGSYTDDPAKRGWYINLAGHGEKILAEPIVFGGVVYYTSYTPPLGGSPCNQAGTGSLYGIDYLTGAGVLSISGGVPAGGGAVTTYRSLTVGAGIPTAPVISFKPGGALPPDLYVTVSGGAGISVSTQRVDFNPPTLVNRTNLIHWRDQRVQ